MTIPYRIKHKPTGLYFKPIGSESNLSKNGKLYMTGTHGLSYDFKHNCPTIKIKISRTQYEKFKDKFDCYSSGYSSGYYMNCKREDFEIEEINTVGIAQ